MEFSENVRLKLIILHTRFLIFMDSLRHQKLSKLNWLSLYKEEIVGNTSAKRKKLLKLVNGFDQFGSKAFRAFISEFIIYIYILSHLFPLMCVQIFNFILCFLSLIDRFRSKLSIPHLQIVCADNNRLMIKNCVEFMDYFGSEPSGGFSNEFTEIPAWI